MSVDMAVGPLVYVMDMTDRIISKLCPFIAGGIFIGSVYWTAVTYGAVTVMQVNGLHLLVFLPHNACSVHLRTVVQYMLWSSVSLFFGNCLVETLE